MNRTLWAPCLSIAFLAGGQLACAADPAPASSLPSAPSTQATDSTPRQVVQATAEEAVAILMDKDLSADVRDARLKKLMRERMDLTTLARLTVGNAWQSFTPAQREAFVQQFADHLLGLYTPLATLYAGQHVELGEDRLEKNGDHTVFVIATDRKGPAGSVRQVATIAARMRNGSDGDMRGERGERGERGWRAIDVTIEGVSIAQTFRSQFQPVVAKQGIDALIEILRQKNAQARSGK